MTFFSTFRHRVNQGISKLPGFITKVKDIGQKAGNVLSNVDNTYKKIQHVVPENYRGDIQKTINSAQDITRRANTILQHI